METWIGSPGLPLAESRFRRSYLNEMRSLPLYPVCAVNVACSVSLSTLYPNPLPSASVRRNRTLTLVESVKSRLIPPSNPYSWFCTINRPARPRVTDGWLCWK